MSTWYKVSTSGTLYGRLELPDEFEQWIRRLEAERDEAKKAAKEWGDLWRKMNDLRVRATMERNEARRWAIHYRRLYEQELHHPSHTHEPQWHTNPIIITDEAARYSEMPPFVDTHDGESITRQSKRSKGGSKNG